MEIDEELIRKGADLLGRGELVAFPTETVYGLGADATNEKALTGLYAAKGRPLCHPVIVHLHALEQVKDWAENVPASFWMLARTFWPGPLTMIVPRGKKALDQVTGGQPAVGLRMPSHPIALALLKEFGEGVAAPSANKFGHVSPTSAKDVEEEFAGEVSLVLDGGPCRVGIESTIVDLCRGEARILRPGMILEAQIKQAMQIGGGSGERRQLPDLEADAEVELRAPGNLPVHYAPQTPLSVVPSNLLAERIGRLSAAEDIAVISFAAPQIKAEAPADWIVADRDPVLYARSIYANLRALDRLRKHWIIVEEPPDAPEWTGIRDRLKRASARPQS